MTMTTKNLNAMSAANNVRTTSKRSTINVLKNIGLGVLALVVIVAMAGFAVAALSACNQVEVWR